MHYLAAPPSRTHRVEWISQASAREIISRYLEAARSQAALHPDAQLTDQGPVAAQGGGRLGLTLHNLGRIEAGLHGERIQPEIDVAQGDQSEGGGSQPPDEWMDKADFERAQDEEDVHVREAPNEREEEDEEVTPEMKRTEIHREKNKRKTDNGVSEPVDREARKKAKKERRKAEKVEKEARRKAGGD